MRRALLLSSLSLIAATGVADPAAAQALGAGANGSGAAAIDADTGDARQSRGGGRQRIDIAPYIEAAQVVSAQLSPFDDVVTYTRLAAGVDATASTSNLAGSLSLRYERRIGYGDSVFDGDTLSGIARVSAQIVPQTLSLEAGALAARTNAFGQNLGGIRTRGASSDTYAVYAGPTLTAATPDLSGSATYRVGYNRVDSDAGFLLPGGAPTEISQDSVSQFANATIGTRPGQLLPVGLALTTGYFQEDVSLLDQRVRDGYIRGTVTVPLTPTIAAVGGLGYENVLVSSRDALVDANGILVIDDSGQYAVDPASPRRIAYRAEGLIWDVGVIWRPSRRTSLEAHVGKRYDSTTYYGSFAWAPTRRSSLNVSVYDTLTGFGGRISNALAALPAQFDAGRNPLTGNLNGCVTGTDLAAAPAAGCLNGVLGPVRSAVFRSRGIAASYSLDLGRASAGLGAGYDRRRFYAAPGTILAAANGVVDETYYLAAFAGYRLDRRSSVNGNVYASFLRSGFGDLGDSDALGASASYARLLTDRLQASAAISLDSITARAVEQDFTYASALLGLRYTF